MSLFQPFDKVLILALESASWELLLPYVKDGAMPALESFLRRAYYGNLESTVPPHTDSAWSTFLTGTDPGQHGVIDALKYEPRRNQYVAQDSNVTRAASFLSQLSMNDIPCGSIFLPRHYPPFPLNEGYVISGRETPSTQVQFTEPDELRTEVLGVAPEMCFNAEDEWVDDKSEQAFNQNMERAIEAIDRLEQLSVHLQRERPVRVQITYMQTIDVLLRKAWRWCSPGDTSDPRRARVRQFFRRTDQLINRVLGLHSSRTSQRFKAVGRERILRMLVSAYGHGPCLGRIHINRLLMDWGFLTPPGSFSRVSRRISLLKLDASSRREKDRELQVDWTQTRAYMPNTGVHGFVYVNLKGREVNGSVPRSSYESVRNELLKRFKDLTIPGSSDPLFQYVFRGEEVFEKKDAFSLPDVVLIPADGYYPSPGIAGVDAIEKGSPNEGGPRMDGIYAFEGPWIEPSRGLGEPAGIVDLAPTLFNALGQPVPESMSGNALLYIFGDNPPNF